jgi:spore coat protein CotH
MGVQSTLPLVSLAIDPDDLWDEATGIYVNPLQKGIDWERTAVLTYVDKDRVSGFQAPVGVRIHGGFTRTYDKKSFRIYFRREYGQPWLDYALFEDKLGTRFKRLVLHSGAQDSPHPQTNWSLIRNQIISRIADSIDAYSTDNQSVLLFVNGQPWGIYILRERIDERFFTSKYGIEDVELLDTPELNENRMRTDLPRENWDQLQQFVATHDLADPDNYSYVATQVDLANLIDYTIIQIYSANVDWPHRNMNMFRPLTVGGRWQWIFWDNDSSLGLAPWSKVDTDMVVRALAPDHPNTGGRDTLLLRKLMANPDFRSMFVQRAADLLNTTLAPEVVVGHIDGLAAELEPNIVHESGRWPSELSWQSTIEDMRHFAQERPDFVRQHMVDYFGLSAFSLTINLPEDGSGQVWVNDWPITAGHWSGVYFEGTMVRVTAVPHPGYQFAGWEPSTLPQSTTIKIPITLADQTITPLFE